MKHVLRAGIVVILVIAVGGCGLFGPPVFDHTGRALRVDSNGHFREDIVYTMGYSTWTFSANGTFEGRTEWFTDGRWQTGFGSRGDYSYDPDTWTAVMNYTHYYDSNSETWQRRTNLLEREFNAYFAEHKWYQYVLVADPNKENSFIFTEALRWENRDREEYSEGFSYNPDRLTFEHEYEVFDYFEGILDWRAEGQIIGTYDTFPEGTALRRGNSVTVRRTIEEQRQRQWDPDFGWSAWDVSTSQYVDTTVMMHMGDAIIWDSSSVSHRGIMSDRAREAFGRDGSLAY